MLFINVTCGIALISVAKFMGLEIIHLDSEAAAAMVMIMSIFNGLGRIFWASGSDYMGRANTCSLFFVLQIAAFVLLANTTNAILFQALVFLILSCYGGGFALVPAFIADLFSTREASAIHGYILTAWAAAGLIGPTVISITRKATGSYQDSLYVFTGLVAAALVVSLLMQRNIRELRKRETPVGIADGNLLQGGKGLA